MSNLKVKLISSGVRDLLKSDEIKTECEKYAKSALGKLGPGYTTSTYVGKKRANASVFAYTSAARRENQRKNTILKAIFGGKK